MQFRALRLAGFKSFVEPTLLEIPAGLTGIVGPNGCGKSNIVEALRWVMGETSAKRMRGGEMDDVIFSGSSGRPARNIAEVTLTLTNDGGRIPAMFEKFEELEVRRRIERGAGSDYRVNGRPVRARDVQLLFADAAIGASSPAMVSQGRISALISAKPSERRYILEDAAGIAGLQSRRHEAELKLRAAETNLEQLQRVAETLRGQETGLKRQARQAEKYREAATRIREAEALLLHCAWLEAIERLAGAKQFLGEAEAKVREAMIVVASAAARESAGEADIVTLRLAEQEAQGTLRGLLQRQSALEGERREIEAARAAALREKQQADADLEHENRERVIADAAIEHLTQEAADIQQRQPTVTAALQAEEAHSAAQREAVAAAEDAALAARSVIAEAEAREAALLRQSQEAEARHAAALQRQLAAQKALDTVAGGEAIDIAGLAQQADAARTALEAAQEKIAPAGERRAAADAALAEARNEAATAREGELRLRAEIGGVESALKGSAAGVNSPVSGAIGATAGYEAALAAALGEDAGASLDADAHYRWAELPVAGSPPKNTQPLAAFITVPPALRRAIAGIGVAPRDKAIALQASLLPGQAIVTTEGALFRWDGLVREAGFRAGDPVAAMLTQRNRLADLQARLEKAAKLSQAAEAMREKAQTDATTAQQQERAALEAVAIALKTAQRADAALADARAREEQNARRSAQAREAVVVAARDVDSAAEALTALAGERAALPDLSAMRLAQQTAADALGQSRAALAAITAKLAEATRLCDQLAARRSAIDGELAAWQGRIATRAQRVTELAARSQQAQQKMLAGGQRPEQIAVELAALMTQLEQGEQTIRVRGDALIAAETDLAERRRTHREAEKLMASAREERVRAESAIATGDQAVEEIQARIAERLNVSAEDLAQTIAFDGNQPDRTALEARLASLTRERDAIGPVNLRAEIELQETTAEIARIEGESAELAEAIARLRQAIGKLNREARERLAAAFEVVRVHFRRLFATLFGGGEAELALTDLTDPLAAGLEIYASPPGKKLQSLSLLSGGEQALTALALLFAMFLATPAPVCVLDEVDAPLDDANVTRFCDLLDEISASTGTRFLVITHHRVTMARMDRLYGVTMAERGVSMLVSVDLRQAELFTGHDSTEAGEPPRSDPIRATA